jgi:hypothetical protein
VPYTLIDCKQEKQRSKKRKHWAISHPGSNPDSLDSSSESNSDADSTDSESDSRSTAKKKKKKKKGCTKNKTPSGRHTKDAQKSKKVSADYQERRKATPTSSSSEGEDSDSEDDMSTKVGVATSGYLLQATRKGHSEIKEGIQGPSETKEGNTILIRGR